MNNPKNQSFAQVLREQRQRAGLSQQDLAEKLGTTALQVNRWESNKTFPTDYYLNQLLQILPALAEKAGSFIWKALEPMAETSPIHIRILEEPLTAQNLLTIISALTELSTKYWLIAKGRFADLIEYTQTHNGPCVVMEQKRQ